MEDLRSIKEILMDRDGMAEDEAQDLIDDAQGEIIDLLDNDGSLCDAEQVIADYFGLEPDYLLELLPT